LRDLHWILDNIADKVISVVASSTM